MRHHCGCICMYVSHENGVYFTQRFQIAEGKQQY